MGKKQGLGRILLLLFMASLYTPSWTKEKTEHTADEDLRLEDIMKALKSQDNESERRFEQLRTEGDERLQQLKTENEERLQALKTENEGRLQQLKTEHDQLKAENEERLQQLKTEHDQLKAENEERMQQLEKENALLKVTESLQQQLGSMLPFDSPVAFTVALSETFSGGGDNAVVPYDVVFLNHGEAYSTSTHQFTAPVRGLYYITISTRSTGYALASIALNGVVLLTSDGGSSNGPDTQVAALMLEAGDQVTGVKIESGNAMDQPINDPGLFNVFAGFLYAQL